MQKNKHWTKEEEQILINNFEYASIGKLLKLLPNRSYCSIYQHGNKVLKLERKTKDKFSINHEAFSVLNEDSVYWLGFIMADGHLKKAKRDGERALQIEVSVRDKDVLYKFKDFLQFDGNIRNASHTDKRTGKTYHSAKMQVNNVKIIEDLNRLGVPYNNKTPIVQFPLCIPNDLLIHFLRGIIDGDGYIGDVEPILGFCGNESIVNSVKDKLPEDCSNITIDKSSQNCWRFKIKGKKAFRIMDKLYSNANVYLDRKYNLYLAWKAYYTQKNSPLHK